MNMRRELDPDDVIAVLMPDSTDGGAHDATVILRGADGQICVRQMNAADATVRKAARTGCFRRGKPILDPVSRQVMGYEMEEVQLARS